MKFDTRPQADIEADIQQLDTYGLAAAPTSTPHSARLMASSAGAIGAPEGTPDASVVEASLIAFVRGMKEQNKEDVRNSVLYATLVANKKFPKTKDSEQWYDQFCQVMSKIGWVFLEKRYDRLQDSEMGLSVDKAGLGIMAALLTSAAVPATLGTNMLKAVDSAIQGLQKEENSKPLSVFNLKAGGNDGSRFNVAACGEDEDGDVFMAIGSVKYETPENHHSVLFFNWDSTVKEIYSGKARITLNPTVYAMARQKILDQMESSIEASIANYEI